MLSNPVLFHKTTYEDKVGNDWLFALATKTDDVDKFLYTTCFRNDVMFTRWISKESD